jgi:hypothetical protein
MPKPRHIPYDPVQHQVLPPEQFQAMTQDVIPSDSPLQFEQRILRPSAYPVLDYRNRKGEGEIATHRMMNAEVGIDGVNTPIAYPSVVYDEKLKRLRELNADQAFEHAMKTGEFRKFQTPFEAESYAEGLYKRHWGQGDAMDAIFQEIQRNK